MLVTEWHVKWQEQCSCHDFDSSQRCICPCCAKRRKSCLHDWRRCWKSVCLDLSNQEIVNIQFFPTSFKGDPNYNGDFHQNVEYLLAGSANWVAGPSLPAKVRGPGATTTSGSDYNNILCIHNCHPCFLPDSTIFVCGSDLAQTTWYPSKLCFDSFLT